MTLDVPDRHPPGVHPQDLVVETGEPALPPLDQLGLEAPLPIPGHLDVHLAQLGLEGLGAGPVPGVRGATPLRVVLLVPQVLGHLGLQGPLHQPGRQLLQDAVLASQVLRLRVTRQQLIQQLLRERGWGLRCHGHRGLLGSGAHPETATYTNFLTRPAAAAAVRSTVAGRRCSTTTACSPPGSHRGSRTRTGSWSRSTTGPRARWRRPWCCGAT